MQHLEISHDSIPHLLAIGQQVKAAFFEGQTEAQVLIDMVAVLNILAKSPRFHSFLKSVELAHREDHHPPLLQHIDAHVLEILREGKRHCLYFEPVEAVFPQ